MATQQEAALDFFKSIPWSASILTDPAYEVTNAESRLPKASGEDALFAEILQTSNTIPYCLFLFRKPELGGGRIEQSLMLVQLERKVNGHPTTAHGGLQAFLLDEAMAKLISVNKDLTSRPGDAERPVTVTKNLNVEFVKPATTPCALLAVAWFATAPDGDSRRYVIAAELRDGQGKVLTKGESVFIKLRGGAKM